MIFVEKKISGTRNLLITGLNQSFWKIDKFWKFPSHRFPETSIPDASKLYFSLNRITLNCLHSEN